MNHIVLQNIKGSLPSSKRYIQGGLLLALILGLGQESRAGYWQPRATGTVQVMIDEKNADPIYTKYEYKDFHAIGTAADEGGLSYLVTSTGQSPGSVAMLSMDVEINLVWVPDPAIPNDTPPLKVWIVESSKASTYFGVTANPWVDYRDYMTPTVENGFQTPQTSTLIGSSPNTYNGIDGKTELSQLQSFGAAGRFVANEGGDTRIPLGRRSLRVRLDINDYENTAAHRVLASISNTEVWWMVKTSPPTFGASRKGSSGSPNIAAGGFGTDEHIAEVSGGVSVPQSYIPPQGIDISALRSAVRISQGERGEEQDAVFSPMGNAIFGIGIPVKLGELYSSDRASASGHKVKLRLNLGLKDKNPETSVYQHWDKFGKWNGGEDGQDPVPAFQYGKPVKLTFRPKFEVPITTHAMNFKVVRVKVREWDAAQKAYVERIYTDRADEVDENATPPVLLKTDMSEYGGFAPAQSGDLGQGTYRAALTVQRDTTNFATIIESVTIAAEDNDVYLVPDN